MCTPKTLSRFLFSLFLALSAIVFIARNARAVEGDETDADEYDVTARVARISALRGDVSLRRNGSDSWETARLNMPLAEGDTVATGRDARLEIQIDARKFVRLGDSSSLTINTLRDEGIALSLSEGAAVIRLRDFNRDKEYFEVDAPNATLAVEKNGLYRIDVAPGENNDENSARVSMTVRDGGLARIYSPTSGFTLRSGRRADLLGSDSEASDWQFSAATDVYDEWDQWSDERDRAIASYPRNYDASLSSVWGADELSNYGSWSYTNDYGWLWSPYPQYISVYNNWTPYRYGYWDWFQPFGWTWIGYEPWGWTPYHYGRWLFYNNAWCWTPYGYYYRRPVWRPALVAFTYVPSVYGEYIAWYPLGFYHRDPFARNYFINNNRRAPLTPRDIKGGRYLERTNIAFERAVTMLPANSFGARTVNAQAAPVELARRAISIDPVRGRLPVTPTASNSFAAHNSATNGKRGLVIINPPSTRLPERQTGAAPRTPGVPLDNELRRTRLMSPAVNASSVVRRLENLETGPTPRTTRAVPSTNSVQRGANSNPMMNRGSAPPDASSRPANLPKGSTLRIVNPRPRGEEYQMNSSPPPPARSSRPAGEYRPLPSPRVYERPSAPPASTPRVYERPSAPPVRSAPAERPSAPPRQAESAPRSSAPASHPSSPPPARPH